MVYYRAREGQIAAADTKTELSTLGGQSPGALKVPSAASKIVEIHSAFSASMAAGAATYLIHLSGDGIKGGTQVLVHGGENYLMTTDGILANNKNAKITRVDIPVNGGDSLMIEGEMSGSDLGTIEAAVGLVFE